MLRLNVTIDQLAMANSVHCYGDVLRREDGHVLRRAVDLEVEGQRKKGRPKRTLKRQVEEESVKVGLRMENAFCRSNQPSHFPPQPAFSMSSLVSLSSFDLQPQNLLPFSRHDHPLSCWCK